MLTRLLGALYVRISILALTFVIAVPAIVAVRQPESTPYLVAGLVPLLVLTGAIALLCRAGSGGGATSASSAHAEGQAD